MPPPDELFTRDEALGGLPARRAAALLFLIEGRAAHLADQSRRAADFLASEAASHERDLAFLEAFSVGRKPPVKPTIQDLERYAPRWAPLVPANPSLRAAVTHLLARKYAFTRRAVPGIRTALGLDDDGVKRAYRRQHGVDLETLYTAKVGVVDWLRWGWATLSAQVDSLPPFWLTFGLTIAFSFSQAFLALPTGLARVGPLPGVVLVVALGLVNVLTMACMAEACARSGDFHYGRAFVGRLVINYLGTEASALFSAMTALRTFLVMLAGSIGIGLTLATFTGIRAEVWMVLLMLVELYYLSRKSSSVTIATMLSMISLNLLVLLVIAFLAFMRAKSANLLYMRVPLMSGAPLEPELLRLVVGVVMMLYIGHVYVIQCAKIVLPRDPSARSLIQGSVAGTAVLTVVFSVWVLAVNGMVDAETLAGETGTALTPLARMLGPSIRVLGSVLVILLLGMSCLRTSTVLFNLVQERIPTRLRSVVRLPRRRGSLFFQPRRASGGGPSVSITYLGLAEDRANLRVEAVCDGVVERADVSVPESWDASAIFERFESRAPSASLFVEVLEARHDAVSMRITTTMSVELGADWSEAGVHLADMAALDDSVRGLITWVTRQGEVGLDEAAAHLDVEGGQARTTLDHLVAQGVLQSAGIGDAPRYRVRLATRHGRRVPAEIWHALEVPAPPTDDRHRHRRDRLTLGARGMVVGEGGRFLLSASPVLVVFILAEWLLLAKAASFAGVLGFGGVIINTLTAGIFPVLLLFASRRKGDYVPGVVYRLLGHPAFAFGMYLLCLMNLFGHGLFIYRDPWSRGAAILFGVAVLAITGAMLRRRAFAQRSVVELRQDAREAGASVLNITSAGEPLVSRVRLIRKGVEEDLQVATAAIPDLSTLRYAVLELTAGPAREVKVWAHRITPEGDSEALATTVEICCGETTRRFDLKLSNGQAVVPVSENDCLVRMTFPEAETPGG